MRKLSEDPLKKLITRELDFYQANNSYKNKIKKNIQLSAESLPVKAVAAVASQVFGNILKNALG